MHLKLHLYPNPSVLTCVLGAQKNRLIETVLLSTQHMFWLRNKKVNFPVCTLIWRPGLYGTTDLILLLLRLLDV